MFSLTIVFGPGPMVWTLMYKKANDVTADSVAMLLDSETAEILEIKDDFGQRVLVKQEQLHGWMVEDLDQSKFAHIESALHKARTKVTGDKIAESDPVLKEAQRRAQGGMPMIQPAMQGFGPNGRFPS